MEKFGDIFGIMTSEAENKMCVDCMRPYPLYASINNGVFICESCAEIHMNYGINISYVKHLKSEWDEYLLSYMRRGGNKRFNEFLKEYEIIENAEAYYKYRTRAAENYREILRSEVLAEEPPIKISKSVGILLSENLDLNNYPEFENYQYIGNISEIQEEEKKNDFSAKLKNFFGKMGKEMKSAAEKIKEKFNQMHIGEKLKNTGKKFIIVVKDAEGFIIMKSQPVLEKSKANFEKISSKTKESFLSFADKTKEFYQNIKTKFTKKNETSTDKLLEETQHNSAYYELKTNPPQNEHNILKYINEEDNPVVKKSDIELLSSSEIADANKKYHENQLIKPNNSFTLLSNSSENELVEENSNNLKNTIYPTLKELENYENMPRIYTNQEKHEIKKD